MMLDLHNKFWIIYCKVFDCAGGK